MSCLLLRCLLGFSLSSGGRGLARLGHREPAPPIYLQRRPRRPDGEGRVTLLYFSVRVAPEY